MVALAMSALGIVIIAWTLREIFQDLFQPSGSGSLSSWLARWLFKLSKRRPSTMHIVGPLCIVIVITCWALLVAVGFAFIYWPRFPQAFLVPSQEPVESFGRFGAVLYFSLASLTTVGSGEFAAKGDWTGIVASCESLIGMSLITASVTWIVLIYPALGRMRALSRRTANLIRAEEETGIDLFSGHAGSLLEDLAASVIRVRVDFIHFPLIYYFHADTEGASLARSLEKLADVGDRASQEQRPESIRLGGSMLLIALSDMAGILAAKFVGWANVQEPKAVFDAVRRDHLERDHANLQKQYAKN